MASFNVDAQRVDPYKNFTFRVRWEGRHVAGISKVDGLQRSTGALRESGAALPAGTARWPQRSRPQAIVLERGVSHDRAFVAWAEQGARCVAAALPDQLRKDITIEVYDAAGELALACTVRGCRVATYQALPDLHASANGVAILRLLLEHERFEGDTGMPGMPAVPAVAERGPA